VTGSWATSDTIDGVIPDALPPRFTYASDELGRSGQSVVRLIEWATGQPRIRRMYERYARRGRPPELFWQDAVAELRLDLRLNRRPADAIPASGPLMVVANHPFGVVDGIILCWLVAQVRPDYQIMTHRVLHLAPEVRPRILPVDFSGTEAATLNNLRSRRWARSPSSSPSPPVPPCCRSTSTTRTAGGSRPRPTSTRRCATPSCSMRCATRSASAWPLPSATLSRTSDCAR